jgi:hypothetical protein
MMFGGSPTKSTWLESAKGEPGDATQDWFEAERRVSDEVLLAEAVDG